MMNKEQDLSPPSSLERLARTHPELEIWWDSSPLVFSDWAQQWLQRQSGDRMTKEVQLRRFFHAPATARLIAGVTTNPPLCQQVIEADPPTWGRFAHLVAADCPDASTYEIFWYTYREIVRRGAAMMRDLFHTTNCSRGYLSGQVDPRQLHDTEAMVAQALSLTECGPNLMIKMPGTAAGIEGIRRLTARGIATNATLTFSVSQLIAVAEAVRAGLEEAKQNQASLSCWRSVGTFMLGRFEDAAEFRRQADARGIALSEADLRWAGIAVFKRICNIFAARGYATKPLAASMRIGPTLEGRRRIWHLEKLAGLPVVLTIFPNVIEAFLEEYDAEELVAAQTDIPPEVLDKLLQIPYFLQAYEEDGLSPEEFASFPAAVETATNFSQATEEMLAWTGKVLNT